MFPSFFVIFFWSHDLDKVTTAANPGGAIANLKPTKVTLLTMILYNSDNSIRDIGPFCRPLFCHSSVVKYASFFLQYYIFFLYLYFLYCIVLYNVFTPTRKNARLQHALQLREKENAIAQMKSRMYTRLMALMHFLHFDETSFLRHS